MDALYPRHPARGRASPEAIGLTTSTARIEQNNVLHRLEVMAAITSRHDLQRPLRGTGNIGAEVMRAIDLAGKNPAYAAGFYDGRRGNPAVSDDPEYMAGFDLGRHVQAGYENPPKAEPAWFRALPWWAYPALLVAAAMVSILAMRTGV